MDRERTKSVPVALRMASELHAKALESAAAAERTLSAEIRLALKTHLKQHVRTYDQDKGGKLTGR